MAHELVSEYCPRCQVVQPTFQFVEDGVPLRRCQTCGFPVETGLTLEPTSDTDASAAREIKILCVDDDPLILQMLGDILRFRGYTVVTAPDGEMGLDAAVRERPDLVLLDVMMPGIDGFEVCRLLKADPNLKAIPVVILTAMNDPKLSARAFEAGAILALQKTAETTAVLRTIEAALAITSHPAPGSEAPPEVTESQGKGGEAGGDLSIPMRRVSATFWSVDGATFEGALFLHLNAETHEGPETVLDRLNDPNLFLTLSVAGDSPVVFLNKIQLVRADLPPEAHPLETSELLEHASVERIRVQLINGEQLTGTVVIEGPAGRRRLSDFLNTHPAFLPLQGSEHLHLLHKRFISRIVPQRS
jgi:CheY-like chemotaxis protein/Zn ribbon nucleic-acid-binding protein